jgi:hypothetical protein
MISRTVTTVLDAPAAPVFEFLKPPEADDALFEAQYRSLQRELENVRARFGAAP